MGGYLAELDLGAMQAAGITMEKLLEDLKASLSSVTSTSWQV